MSIKSGDRFFRGAQAVETLCCGNRDGSRLSVAAAEPHANSVGLFYAWVVRPRV